MPAMFLKKVVRLEAAVALVVLVLGIQGLACAEKPGLSEETKLSEQPSQPGKPLLSEEVRVLLAEYKGGEALRSAMMELYSAGLDGYENDESTGLALAGEYLEAGEYDQADAVAWFQMVVSSGESAPPYAVMGDVAFARGEPAVAGVHYASALRVDPDYSYAQQQLEAADRGEVPTRPKPAVAPEVGRRDDLARFKGRYEMEGESGRVISVSETCYRSGTLRAAAEWGDVAPWDFASVSDAVFEQADPPSGAASVRLEFELDMGSAAYAFVASGAVEGHFERIGELVEGWEPEDCKGSDR